MTIEQYAYTVMVVFLLLPIGFSAFAIRGILRGIAELRTTAITYRELRIAGHRVIALLLVVVCIAACCWALQIPSWMIPALERDISAFAGTAT